MTTLPPDITDRYVTMRCLPDGRIIGVARLLFHWTLHIGIDIDGYADRYCYATREQAEAAALNWDGVGDPGHGWHRHPMTERRRPNGDASKEYVAS